MMLEDNLEGLERQGFVDLDDHQLVCRVAEIVGVPRREIPDDRFSFVLHAPLELMARAALLPSVPPSHRHLARRRIVSLAAGYEASGPPLDQPPSVVHASTSAAAADLVAALTDGDGTRVDGAAAWLGARSRPVDLVRLLSETFVDRLGAAGHANIYLALLARTQPRGLPGQMLRPLAAALASNPSQRIQVPDAVVAGRSNGSRLRPLLDVLCEVAPIGPPPAPSIASIVEHAQDHGVLATLTESFGDTAVEAAPHAMLRFAAQAMLQGPDQHAPFGWTHCLTLAQAPLLMTDSGGPRSRAVYVAAVYLAAHWAALGLGTVDLRYTPDPVVADLDDALLDAPTVAASAAWHGHDTARTATRLVAGASINHDAHRVKYTLACLDAAASDPDNRRLYLAAAAYLHAWWNRNPDASDPLGVSSISLA